MNKIKYEMYKSIRYITPIVLVFVGIVTIQMLKFHYNFV